MSGRRLRRALARRFEWLLAPGLCLACGVEILTAESLCPSCALRLLPVPNPCRHCAEPNPVDGDLCPACLLNPPRWQSMIAPLQYRGLTRHFLHRLKYDDALYLARTLSQPCIGAFAARQPRPQVILPVPLHDSRLVERGYNQALELAQLWSRRLEIPLDRRALYRIRQTSSQSGLSAARRESNLRGAFRYAPRRAYRHVAIADDIVTTGSTVNEICKMLHRDGVEYVEVWALARAYHR